MTPEELAAIRQRVEAASAECGDPYFFTPTGRQEDGSWSVMIQSEKDVDFLSEAKVDVLKLLDRVEELEALVAEQRQLINELNDDMLSERGML